jgi:hypothetical protein
MAFRARRTSTVEAMIEVWVILAVTFTVLYLIAALVEWRGIPSGPGKSQSFIFALIAGPISATAAIALWYALVFVYWFVITFVVPGLRG